MPTAPAPAHGPLHGLAPMDLDNSRFVAAILRAHLHSRTMPPGWTQPRFFAAALHLGVIAHLPGEAR